MIDNEKPHGILSSNFGLREFRKGQVSVLDSVLKREDTLAVMPTGGGKSLCYQLPSLFFNGLVIVVSPLIALMKDQVRQLKALGLRAGCIHSGQSAEDKRDTFRDLRAPGPYLLYLSPERVQTEGFIDWLKNQKVVLFAIDEAHCVSQWGHDFREDYAKLGVLRALKPEVPILALTATATPRVLGDIEKQLGVSKAVRHVH
ncbi:MAG TPA: RecQ family ATP-dependent DNA helicase, partial [Bdellovibrionales bacterium]|nr:RecQ family ATP-dependent DNA helicase [Bdellovibrionales bacterium]